MFLSRKSVLKKCVARFTHSLKASDPMYFRSGAFSDAIVDVSLVSEQQKKFLNELYLTDKAVIISDLSRDSITSLQEGGYTKLIGKSGKFCEMTEFGRLLSPVDAETYFKKNHDPMHRTCKVSLDLSCIELLAKVSTVFDKEELKFLNQLNNTFHVNKAKLSSEALKREHQRVMVDYIWKSASLEGNTYTLMETDFLLQERITQKGKLLDEVLMIVDHKAALDKVIASSQQLKGPLTVDIVKEVHGLLARNLPIPQGVRNGPVVIGGTRYQPPADRSAIEDALSSVLTAINAQSDPFSASLVSTVLFSYLQVFFDGNKRTARMLGHGIMLANDLFPLTYRMIEKERYLEALMLFYERGNVGAFKEIFLQQAEFSAMHYYNLRGPEKAAAGHK